MAELTAADRDLAVQHLQGVYDRYVGINVFPLAVTLFWLYMLQPGRNVLVGGADGSPLRSSASGRTVTTRQTSSEQPRREDDYL